MTGVSKNANQRLMAHTRVYLHATPTYVLSCIATVSGYTEIPGGGANVCCARPNAHNCLTQSPKTLPASSHLNF
jgi:hypothetical protein